MTQFYVFMCLYLSRVPNTFHHTILKFEIKTCKYSNAICVEMDNINRMHYEIYICFRIHVYACLIINESLTHTINTFTQ
jgi:hypothetical protein